MIDISVNLNKFKILYPGSKNYEIFKKENSSYFNMDSHYGTHVDAPSHFIEGGKTIEELNSDYFVGICQVIDNLDLENVKLKSDRVFFKLNDNLINNDEFYKDYLAFNEKNVDWILNNNINVIGIDYLSIESFDSKDFVVHKKLLEKEILIIESLNLNKVGSGLYKYYCFPIRCSNEASPVRVFLEKIK